MASLITGTQIFTRAGRILNDETNVRWSSAELLDLLNSGQRAIALIKPNVSVSTQNLSLVAGTKQSLPDNIIALDELVRNINADDSAGPAILPIEKVLLDNSFPGWHTSTPSATVTFYCYDLKSPDIYWVFPPQPTATAQKVEAIMEVLPANVATAANPISLDDIYEPPLLEYILYRCFLKDSEVGSLNYQRAMGHYQTMLELLNIKSAAERMEGPVMPVDGSQPAAVPPQQRG
jgi:hypothetical protein